MDPSSSSSPSGPSDMPYLSINVVTLITLLLLVSIVTFICTIVGKYCFDKWEESTEARKRQVHIPWRRSSGGCC